MPQEPKKRHSKARKRTRRASINLKTLELIKCKNCQEMTLPHQACRHCGFYTGKKAEVKTKARVTKA